MHLTIVTPRGLLCRTESRSIHLPGAIGPFTVLPGHAPLVAHLTAGEIRYEERGEERRVAIRNGFVRVERDAVEVCAELPDQEPKR